MLSQWGTTCGRCRPSLVEPKTLYLSPGQVAPNLRDFDGMTLGWLVVLSSVDRRHQGALIELDQDRLLLSRGGSAQPPKPGVFEFSDIFMSTGHAIVSRPRTNGRNDAFTIRERESAPTANGTFVNSRRVSPSESVGLADGDVIRVGATQMVFRSLWLPASATRVL
jgi:FHA domain-containing protein